ncbi:MAG: PEP-CTERM sorting domain-containing protein [Okeania sp. SIO3B5]|uniref:NF038130 family PEP-CTERM protein n=1 Tax=Okeania sp. SIO3B5 TaxID=2607811 RepID=UPI0014002226|nr:NF038130 family PEP-CTERM protein [Okeania sp. SIO3B5]NEO53988.1 PEP-CTERM sorting domain-containing protein [Okeania sp. SIO3B5]
MTVLVKKFLAGASIVAGMSAVLGAPAMAVSLTGATVTGDHVIYGYDQVQGDLDPGVGTALEALNGYGNVELSGQLGNSGAVSVLNPTTLEVLFDDGSDVTFRSFTRDDWGKYGADWFNEAWNDSTSGFQNYINATFGVTNYFQALTGFTLQKGYQQFSDPNVASVSKDDEGNLFFTLAGHNNHSSGVNLSELIIAEVNGKEHFLYKIGGPDRLATVFDDDSERSHEGLYDFEIKPGSGSGILGESIPEPSTVLGLMAIGGLLAATKRKSQK